MKLISSFLLVFILLSCNTEDEGRLIVPNPEVDINIPNGFPELNYYFNQNKPTLYGVQLGEKLFTDKKLSKNNSISCASCHNQVKAFTDSNPVAIGVENRVGFRNTPPIQNLAFMKFYNWDGSKLQLEKQPLVPIITHEEMNSSILDVINKIKDKEEYKQLFLNAFGTEEITQDRIFRSIAQYEYTLVSANSKYDKVKRNEGVYFTDEEERGYAIFQQKCNICHSSELFTDQSFRNIGFPNNPNQEEAGRARVTGDRQDRMKFRVPSLRNIGYTAPYGSFGQFWSLKEVLDYMDAGVIEAENLDEIFKQNRNKIPLTEHEKEDLIAFMNTLNDPEFVTD